MCWLAEGGVRAPIITGATYTASVGFYLRVHVRVVATCPCIRSRAEARRSLHILTASLICRAVSCRHDAHFGLSRKRTVTSMNLKERYTKDEAKKAKDGVARRVKNGSLELMQGAAYKAHIT